ncbi:MAG TPA: hypothetical protein VFD60_05695 [Nitrososphaeraceae archaeon]|jgi:hypothetical protein|nr:hypothetical protein [Nitrososphaeraceae archaeon]
MAIHITIPKCLGSLLRSLTAKTNSIKNGTINAIPIIGYHNIITYPDVSDTNESSATTLNLFDAEMKYLHDNGFRVLTMADLGYDENSNSLYIKTIEIVDV